MTEPQIFIRSAPCVSTAAVAALLAAGCGSGTDPRSPTRVLRVVSSISDGATLEGAVPWTATPAGVAAVDPVARVEFLIDGRRRWVDPRTPYVFNADHGALHPWILSAGEHRLAVRVLTRRNNEASASSRVIVASRPALPAAIVGTWTRRVGKHDGGESRPARIGRQLASGVWRARFAQAGVVFVDGPGGARATEAFTAAPNGAMTLAGPVNWLQRTPPHALCARELEAPYHWHARPSVLTLSTRHDTRCASRAALFSGIWTHR